MRKFFFTFLLLFFFFLLPHQAHAIEYPMNKPNNKIGIHILFDHELTKAAEMVNSNGGDWGYVTIPIQAGEKDLTKWQNFMNTAKQLHLIPIIRLSTEGDYFNKAAWRKPTHYDIIDFANFLNSLDWPTKNRYIIVLNEVNRGDEWGGSANPAEYAEILSFAVSVFKSKSPDYFIISAGLDNAAPNQAPKYYNQYNYMRQMNAAVPNIFGQIDGLASHSYPNPGFSQRPNTTSTMGVGSFAHERALAKQLSNKDLPVFITETGWSSEVVSQDVQTTYYRETLDTIWNDPNIVAIAPFILQGSGGPFQKFTFLDGRGSPTKLFEFFQGLPKVQGKPTFPASVLAAKEPPTEELPLKRFETKKQPQPDTNMGEISLSIYKWLMHL